MDGDTGTCLCCKQPGKFGQGPWPLPVSECYCDDCFTMEGIVYGVWRDLNPGVYKFAAPIPFLWSKADWPPNAYEMTREQVQAWFKDNMAKLVNRNRTDWQSRNKK